MVLCSFPGPQFMTFNVHQLLHLKDSVDNLGPLWSHSCFFFEDLNGDFSDLFHGTQNIDGQVNTVYSIFIYKHANTLCLFLQYSHIKYFLFKIVHGVSVLQKLPELASTISHPSVQEMFTHLTEKNHYKRLVEAIYIQVYM